MSIARRALVLLGVVLLPVGGSTGAQRLSAQDKVYEIADLSARLELRPDGSYRIRETITYDFQAGSFSFALRDIPLSNVDGLEDFSVRSSDVRITGVREEEDGGAWEVRWEFPPTTGEVTFVLDYDLVGAIRERDGENEILWRVVGEGWDVPFRQVRADVVLPPTLGIQASELAADPEDIATVAPEGEALRVRFDPGPLPAGGGYQVRVRFPQVMPGRAVGLARPGVQAALAGVLGFVLFLVLGIVGWSRRRGERLPPRASGHPELDLPTAAVLLHRKRPGWDRAFPATLFDLAERGAITLERMDEKGKVFTSQKVILHRNPEFDGPLTDFEERLLQELEGHGRELETFASKGKEFRKRVMEEIRDGLVRSGHLADDTVVARKWMVLGLLALLGGVVAVVVGGILGRPWLMALLGPAAGAGLGLLIMGGVRYPRTRRGAEALAPLEGYLARLREELKQKLGRSPISAAEFLFEALPWLTVDPKYYGSETGALARKLKKESGELHAPPWAVDRTRQFEKAAAKHSAAYLAFFPVQHVAGAVGGAVAPGAGGGVAGAGGAGGAGGGGGGAG